GQGTPSVEIAPDSNSNLIRLSLGATETSSGCDASRFVAEVPVGHGGTISVSTVTLACAQATESASVADAGSGATYAWTITNGAITSGAGTRTIQYVPNGTGDVTLAATVMNGGCNATGSTAVAVHAPAAIIDNKIVGLCGTSEATIGVTLSGTPPFRIVWSDGNVQDNIGTLTASRTVSHSGSYSIAQISDASCAGRSSGLTEVVVSEKPAITVQPQGSSIRARGSTTLTVAATGGGLRYHWYEGPSGNRSKLVTVTTNPFLITPSLNNTTSYWVEVENDCGSEESHAAVVTVGDTPGKRRAVPH
ncbi:MAG: trimeric autotransporter adhesin, partial [Thermoanaerobaculia bacterium]|nr:trimeric autotransporter adhesin [Thermoanaerobaculia bacterium]